MRSAASDLLELTHPMYRTTSLSIHDDIYQRYLAAVHSDASALAVTIMSRNSMPQRLITDYRMMQQLHLPIDASILHRDNDMRMESSRRRLLQNDLQNLHSMILGGGNGGSRPINPMSSPLDRALLGPPRLIDSLPQTATSLTTLQRHTMMRDIPRPILPPAKCMASIVNRCGKSGIPFSLPTGLACPFDAIKLSDHQYFLRQQIEVFQATSEDITTHIRGRIKTITLGQVGIRCRHCKHLPAAHRRKGSTYFPSSKVGIYQAAQNMSTAHMQSGLCEEMPFSVKLEFMRLLIQKGKSSPTGAGRPYWTKSATQLGLVDTESSGIQFIRDLPPGVSVMPHEEGN
jgi:hypothetical protein